MAETENVVKEFVYKGETYEWDDVNKVYWCGVYFEYDVPEGAVITKEVRRGRYGL